MAETFETVTIAGLNLKKYNSLTPREATFIAENPKKLTDEYDAQRKVLVQRLAATKCIKDKNPEEPELEALALFYYTEDYDRSPIENATIEKLTWDMKAEGTFPIEPETNLLSLTYMIKSRIIGQEWDDSKTKRLGTKRTQEVFTFINEELAGGTLDGEPEVTIDPVAPLEPSYVVSSPQVPQPVEMNAITG